MRIAIGGFCHESHTFVAQKTDWDQFVQPGGLPAMQRPATMIEALRPTSVASAGAIEEADRHGVTLAPLGWCFANPAGTVTRAAFERIAANLLSALSDALEEGPLDGVYLDLHGAMVSEDFSDAEGELLRRVRAIVGDALPLTVSLDPHANMTLAMCEMADALVPFRTYPHVDCRFAGGRAMAMLVERIRRGRPWAMAYRTPGYLTPITSQCTMVEPMAGVMAAREQHAAGTAELAWCFGFPYADFEGCSAAIAAWAETQEDADRAADGLLADIHAREPQFAGSVLEAPEAVAKAIREGGGGRPVVIADTQDNPGGGGHGDTTGLLAELIRQGAQEACFGLINDAEAAAACHAAGEGATVTLALGGKSDGAPLRVTGMVAKLADGRFTLTGPMGKGNPANLGRTALLRVGGVEIVVVSRKMQCHDQSVMTHLGVEPAAKRILAVKSSVHFRAHFQPIASQVIVAAAPGPVVADPATLPFTSLRKGLRLRPGDNRAFS
ncbi:MAG: M81 family metallopeptidase [Acetobacteraceae bacterium]|nr:M81 family metallopeptidase [Acetobacteraceae bacterium]